MDEYESAAIRAYAPEFNTSVPSVQKSLGRMPVIAGTAQVFADQVSPSTAFFPESVKRQINAASKNSTPPWKKGKAISPGDAKTEPEQKFHLRDVNTSGRDFFDALSAQRRWVRGRTAPTQRPERIKTYIEHKGVEIHIDEVTSNEAGERHLFFEWAAKSYGKVIGCGMETDKATAANMAIATAEEHLSEPYRFKINLCDDGSVVTRDGEYLGTWEMDEDDHPSFTPDGETKVLFLEMWIGLLCQKIADWHEAQDQATTS
ncbi:hypothetical protein R5H30_01095 [Sulfitobacter sp. D35]|uniref:hypothetical protein n=1 Tax=Sulfitobacter sp. D35 TaxID=3083252 RepID=UPI00296E8230|nr:hypothetical protein [Sulfitobacter sp. D35]MDW4496560.1 hypothetical protein [Sulfitobacter sp. D35]